MTEKPSPLHPLYLLRLIYLTLVALTPLSAATHWIRVTTPHFEMYTTNNEKQALRALEVFEQVRYFFLQINGGHKQSDESLVRIIAFSSEKEYKPYRLNPGAFAYYQQSHERDYIVMQDLESDSHQTAVHEYTHLIVQHMKLTLPLWLNEGMAELYSSLEPHGHKAMIGRPLESRGPALAQEPWMDWNTLLAVDHASPYYNQPEKMSIFYAQSWLLVHMLNLSEPYRPGFPKFLKSVSDGASSPDALQRMYGKSVEQVGADVERYWHSTSVKTAVYNIDLPKSTLDGHTVELSDFQSGLALADLLATSARTAAEARSRLLTLQTQDAHNADIHESLGYLAWQENHLPEAQHYFSLAIRDGSKNVRMFYECAQIARANGTPLEETEGIIRKAMALDPSDNEGPMLLGDLELADHRYGAALAALAAVHVVKPDQAFRFFSSLAYTYANLHDVKNAKISAARAQPYATTDAEKLAVNNIFQFVDQSEHLLATATAPEVIWLASPALERASNIPSEPTDDRPQVRGKTKAFECGNGTFHLRVQVADRELVFAISDPKAIVVRNVKDLEWTCGALKSQDVTVVYRPSPNPKLAGAVAELIF